MMLRVGLTGGLASGKTFVGQVLESLGCYLIQADLIGHALLHSTGAAYAGVLAEFGKGILGADDEIDRKKLGRIVFPDPALLERLNEIVHPLVFRREEELLQSYAVANPYGIGIVEAAILIETGSYRKYDRIVVAYCEERLQIERAMQRGGLTQDEAEARVRRQMPLKDKLAFADHVVDTSGTKEQTRRETRKLYEELRRLAG